MSTPSITPAQIAAFLSPILAVLVAFGVPITEAQSVAILGLSTTISTALVIADAMIRRARAANAEQLLSAKAVHALAVLERAKAQEAELEKLRAPLERDVEDLGYPDSPA